MADVDAAIERLEGLTGTFGVSEDHVRLRIGLLRAQAKALEALGDIPRDTEATERLSFDPVVARALFDSVVEVCGTYGSTSDDFARLAAAVGREPEMLQPLVRGAVLRSDEKILAGLAWRLDVPAPTLLFVRRIVAAPMVIHAVREAACEETAGGTCPKCGSPPAMATLRPDDGARMLHCSLCGAAWPAGRLACPFCGTEDPKSLSRAGLEEHSARWIEGCQKCRHYLRTVDRRRLPAGEDVFPVVEEVAGLGLDLLAEQLGYHRRPPYAGM